MAVNRNYSSTMPPTQLASPVSASATFIPVQSLVNNPTVPFTLVIDPGTDFEEITTVTSVTGLSLTVQRGQDGTAALAHAAGATARHMVTARDLREPQQHIADSSGVHGIGAGADAVGTTTTQTLTNKNISGAQNTITGLSTAALNDGAVTSAKIADGTIDTVDLKNSAVTDAKVASGIDSNKINNLIDGTSAGVHYSRLSTHGYGLGTMATVRANDSDGSAPSGDVWYVNTKGPSAALIGVTDQGVLSHATVPHTLFGDPTVVTAPNSSPTVSGWALSPVSASQIFVWGPFKAITLVLRTATSGISFGASGNITDTLVYNLTAPYRPKRVITTTFRYASTGDALYGGTCMISPDGTVKIISGAPNTTIRTADTTSYSIVVDATYMDF